MTTLPLAPVADKPVPKLVPCPPEGDPDGATSCADTGSDSNTKTTSTSNTSSVATTRLAVLADLLADLPAPERRAVIATLPPTECMSLARLLVSQQHEDVAGDA